MFEWGVHLGFSYLRSYLVYASSEGQFAEPKASASSDELGELHRNRDLDQARPHTVERTGIIERRLVTKQSRCSTGSPWGYRNRMHGYGFSTLREAAVASATELMITRVPG